MKLYSQRHPSPPPTSTWYHRAIERARSVVSPPRQTEVIKLGKASAPSIYPPRARLTEWTSGDAKDVIPRATNGDYRLLGHATTEILLHGPTDRGLNMLFGLLGEGRWITDPPELAHDIGVMLAGDHEHPPESLELEDVRETARKTSQGVKWSPSGAGLLGLKRSAVGGMGIWRPYEFVRRDGRWVPVLSTWSIEHFGRRQSDGAWLLRASPREHGGYLIERPTTVNEYTAHKDPITGTISYYPDWMTCTPWGPDTPWNWGWWTGLIWPAMVSGPQMWTQLGRMLESRAMSGLLVGSTTMADQAALTEFANRLYQAGEMGVFAINKDREDVKSIDTGANQGAQVFDSAETLILRWIEITLLGGARLWSNTGTESASKVQKELIETGIVASLGNAIASWIASGPGALWGRWNGYSRVSCRFVVPWEQSRALESVGPVIDRLIELSDKQILPTATIAPLVIETLAQAGIEIEAPEEVSQLPDTVPVPIEVIQQVALGRQLASAARLPSRTPGRTMGYRLSMGVVDQRTAALLLGWHRNNPGTPTAPGWGNRLAPAPEWVEWLLHGGDAGMRWAEGVISGKTQPELPAAPSPAALLSTPASTPTA